MKHWVILFWAFVVLSSNGARQVVGPYDTKSACDAARPSSAGLRVGPCKELSEAPSGMSKPLAIPTPTEK